MMLHGTADTDVPCQESLDMAEQLKKHGVRHEMFVIPGAGHGLGGGNRQLVDKAMARAREFIKELLSAGPKPAGQPTSGPGAGPGSVAGPVLEYRLELSTMFGSDADCRGMGDSGIAKFSPTGKLLAATYLGGSGDEINGPDTISVAPTGKVLITGGYGQVSTGYPVTPVPWPEFVHVGAGGELYVISRLDRPKDGRVGQRQALLRPRHVRQADPARR
jgi:hypothetical protein